MIKVKFFRSYKESLIEREMNGWLEEHRTTIQVCNTQLSISRSGNNIDIVVMVEYVPLDVPYVKFSKEMSNLFYNGQ